MKTRKTIALLSIALCALTPVASYAHHTTHPEVTQSILNQAETVRHDAAIYQRQRITRGVMQIEKDALLLDKSIVVHLCLKADRAALRTAVSQLHSASLNSDAAGSMKAVDQIVAVSFHISKTVCNDDLD